MTPDRHVRTGPNERGRWVEVLDKQRLAPPVPWNAPHPVTGCTCREGRILEEVDLRNVTGSYQLMTVAWLPAVHDCALVAARARTPLER